MLQFKVTSSGYLLMSNDLFLVIGNYQNHYNDDGDMYVCIITTRNVNKYN